MKWKALVSSMLKKKTEAMVIGTQVQNAQEHIKEKQDVYIAAGVGILVGAVLMALLQKKPVIIVNSIAA